MDPLGNNKIFAAILAAALVFMGIRMLPEVFMHQDTLDVPAYIVGELETSGAEEEVELPFPQPEWIAAMDADRGARVFRNCTSCHVLEKGVPNGTGPGLWNVVGAPVGTHAGYAYSDVMGNAGYNWSYESLDAFLERPKSYMPGTKMNFAGIRKESDRAAVIEYLRLAADSPLPRPEPAAVEVELTVEAEEAVALPDEAIITDETVDPSEMDGEMAAEDDGQSADGTDEAPGDAEYLSEEEQDGLD
ncbi:MAG: cytochrome c family protein [Pseudomonadota bacterium]